MKTPTRFKVAGGKGRWIAWDDHSRMQKWERYAQVHLIPNERGWWEQCGCGGRSPAEALHRIKMRAMRREEKP
jgi:hypothetical protein